MGGRQFDDLLFQRYLVKVEQQLREFNRQMSVLGAQESPFCMEGCAHCCHHIFFVSTAEIDVVAARLLRDESLLAHFVDRARQRETQLRQHVELLSACEDRGMTGGRAALDFMRLMIPCALLDNNRCLIYDIRPMACASFVSIVPPRICASAPKGSLSAPMNQLLAETRRLLGKFTKNIGAAPVERLDISRQVLQRLAEIGRTPASR